MSGIADLLGRICLATIFLFEAYRRIDYFNTTKTLMAQHGINGAQTVLLILAIMVLILGGLMVLLGYRAKFGAGLLLMYWVPVTFMVHDWWNLPFDIQRQTFLDFIHNLAIIGGLLMVIVHGTGRYSLRRMFATTRVPG